MNRLYFIYLFYFFTACVWNDPGPGVGPAAGTVGEIVLPAGYKRIVLPKNSFGEWLRNIALKQDNHVYLYNGALKKNQSAQYAVLDIPVGTKDLQQCADAVMRLRAEYLFEAKRYSEILFRDNNGKAYKWEGGDNRPAFEKYLEQVFGWCGSASLEKQLNSVAHVSDMQPGDVFIKGGFPGHAMIVMDMAINAAGRKIFMLAQSYMPAQDIHIVKNPVLTGLSPWYIIDDSTDLITPEWTFARGHLRNW